MAIEQATITTDTFTTIHGELTTLFPTKNVYAKFPDNYDKLKKSDYPLVVLTCPKVSPEKQKFGLTPSIKKDEVTVEVYSNNPQEVDEYTNTIRNHFETTRVSGVNKPIVNDSDVGVLQINNLNVSFRMINIQFMVV